MSYGDGDDDVAVKLGRTLGVLTRYGAPTVRQAIDACANGTGTPKQQRIVVEFLRAATNT